jgi:hypothetical protein
MALTVVDFSHLTASQAALLTTGNTLTLNGYQFTGDTAPAATGGVGMLGGLITPDGLIAPAAGHHITVTRVDGQMFTVNEIDTFVGGNISSTGNTDVELMPFDPVTGKSRGQLNLLGVAAFMRSAVTIDTTVYPTLLNMSSMQILGGASLLVDHFTAFKFTSPADPATPAPTTPVPEPAAGWLIGAGAGIMLLLARRRSLR